MKLINGDCFVELNKIPDNSVDCILIDPPYGNTWLKWDKLINMELLWKQFNRIKKDKHTPILIFSSGKFTTLVQYSNFKNYKYSLIWVKEKGSDVLNSNRKPLNNIEYINVFYEKQPVYNPQKTDLDYKHTYTKKWNNIKENKINGKEYQCDMKNAPKTKELTNIGKFPLLTNNWKNISIKNRLHPTEKPQESLEWLIKTYTNENDIVLDCFMGSGSTGVACKNLNRHFIGIELDETYFNIAKDRINNER